MSSILLSPNPENISLSLSLSLSQYKTDRISFLTSLNKERKQEKVKMGGSTSKKESNSYKKDMRNLTGKIMILQSEINEMMVERDKENRAYEEGVMIFAFKEMEWKKERMKLREEVKRLRKMLKEKEELIRGMEKEMVGEKTENDWQLLGTHMLVEHINEERARRDEAAEKWKKLYLAIKTELDDLIQTTHQGERLYLKAEEVDMMATLQRELKAKEKTIEDLKTRLDSMEKEEYKKEREVDILRQSLRIMTSKKASKVTNGLSQSQQL